MDAKAYTTTEGARNADARLVAPIVDGIPEELPSSSGLTTPSFETARAPVDDMRKRLRELRAPVCGTKAQMWRRVLEREAIERRHLDEEALMDRRRRDLESDPTHQQNLNAQLTKSRIPQPAPWCETCTLGRGIEAPHGRGVFTRTAEHAPPGRMDCQQVRVYIPVLSIT